jgi:hypothetical protein
LTGKALVAPGAYVVRVTVSDGLDSRYTDVTITVTQEDARATYTGLMFISTSCATCSKATVTLAATIQDITAVDSTADPNAGDIRNATVTFINRDTNTVIATVPVGLVNTNDTKTGTATYNWNVDLGSQNSADFTIGIIVGGSYTRNSSTDDTVITVSKPLSGFITGGGYLMLSRSTGQVPGDAGTKANFGFNVKYTKSGTNLQGHVNIIVRNGGHVYQIKSTSITSLTADATTGIATFTGKGNIQDITDPLTPISIDGNASLQMTMTDKGEPGSNDTLGIILWNKSGGLWFSSNWNGTKTVEQTLSGGNLVVH